MENFDFKGAIINWLFLFFLFAIIFLIGRSFSQLAAKFGKTRWLYSIIGILTFFLATGLGTRIEFFLQKNNINVISGLLRLPTGLLLTWTIYQVLKKQWMKNN